VTLVFDATDADLALFLDEAAEQIETLSRGLLHIERDGDAQLVQAVFRAAHTLKGSSATIGHARMARLTHAMEGVLDGLRSGALAPGAAVIDCLLACVDALAILCQEVRTREQSQLAVEVLVERLQEIATAPGPLASVKLTSPAPGPAGAVATTNLAGHVHVEVIVDPSSAWPAVRAYQVLTELGTLGRVASSEPSVQQLEDGDGGQTLSVLLETDCEVATIEAAARAVAEVTSVTVRRGVASETAVVPPVEERQTAAEVIPPEDRRRADLGPETRGASIEEQLVVAGSRLTTAARMVKVDIGRLDALMNLAGELAIDRGRLQRVIADLARRLGADTALDELAEVTQHLSRLSDDLQEQVMLSRLLPVESLFNRFPRMVRDLARKGGKFVHLEIAGAETGLDRSVIDEIGDPILHLLRNAVDHGVETPEERQAAGKPAEATVRLAARHEESRIVIEVSDDGRGIDPARMREAAVRKGLLSAEEAGRVADEAAIDLIFAPGFSSAEQVTHVSGRGVGLDIVRTNIEKLNGAVTIDTARGEGTTFTITLPLTLAIIRALLVRVGGAVYTLPLVSVQEALRVEAGSIRLADGRPVVPGHGQPLPLAWLGDALGSAGPWTGIRAARAWYVVVVRAGETDLGLVVDGLIGQQEVVIKSVSGVLGEIEGITGVTILGDGRVSMIVDVPWLVERLACESRAERPAA
jgi:two-component system chemotaxis sensor kinase CheA